MFRLLTIGTLSTLLATCHAIPVQDNAVHTVATSHRHGIYTLPPSVHQQAVQTEVIANDRNTLYQHAHEQLLQRAELEKAQTKQLRISRYRRPARDPNTAKSIKHQAMIHRRKVAQQLGLHRASTIPHFAKQVPIEGLNMHSAINDWNYHRDLIEMGIIGTQDLPDHLKPVRGSFRFNKTTGKKGADHPCKTSIEERRDTEHRREKLMILGLHQSSALPTFARNVPLDKIKGHDQIEEWHRHREMLEDKKINFQDLPKQFKTVRGQLKLKSKKARIKTDALRREAALSRGTKSAESSKEVSDGQPISQSPSRPSYDSDDFWDMLRNHFD